MTVPGLPDAEEIKEAGNFVQKVSHPRNLLTLIVLLACTWIGAHDYWNRQDAREDRAAFLSALKENTGAIEKLSIRLDSLADEIHDRAKPAPAHKLAREREE